MVAARSDQTATEERLSHVFSEFCQESDLLVLSLAADKHGSTVWEAGGTVDGLDRYIELALTPIEQSRKTAVEQRDDEPLPSYLVTLTLTIDDGESYTLQPFEQWRVGAAALDSDETLLEQIERSLALCWRRALQLTAQNLTGRYPFPHRSVATSR